MKFYSENLKRFFDTQEECQEADKKFYAERKNIKNNKTLNEGETPERLAKEKVNGELNRKEKKVYADKIQQAEQKIEEANKEYELAQDKAAEILEKSNKEVKEILETALEKVKVAEREKRDAIVEFNKRFGAYTTQYTGEKAIEEFNKAFNKSRLFNPFNIFDIFDDLF